MERVLKLVGITLIVPAVGVTVGVLADADLLTGLSLAGAAVPVVLLAAQLAMAGYAGRDRAKMAAVFPALTHATVYGLIVMIAIQTVVALAALWIAEHALLGMFHAGVMIAVAAAALGAAWGLTRAALQSGRRPELLAVGRLLTPADAPRLYEHVRGLAQRLGAVAPDHIVIGIEATFYVTSADVLVPGRDGPLRGGTLYLSSTLARLFSPAELDAVIGHELGHFRGEDTAYSLRFAPVYAGLGRAIGGMLTSEGGIAWTALPALHLLAFLYDLFDEAGSAVGRERELEADRAGVEAAGAEALGTALMKVSIHADAWDAALAEPAELGSEAADGNLPLAFRTRVAQGFNAAAWREALETGLGAPVAHPVDTHPPVRVRLAAIGVDPYAIDPARLKPPNGPGGAALIDDLEEIEQALSGIYLEAAEPSLGIGTVLSRVADGVGEPVRA